MRFFLACVHVSVCVCVRMQDSEQSWLLSILHGYGCDRI